MKRPSILDPKFCYVSSNDTNIRLTFRRERARLKATAAAKQPAAVDNVRPLATKATKKC